MYAPGCKPAKSFSDDVTVLEFGANAKESEILQLRDVVLEDGVGDLPV